MPILAPETDLFPEDLLTQDFVFEDNETHWWTVYTRSRQEKQLSRSLLACGIPFYCPTVPHRFRSPNGRTRTSYLPLFPNYLFIRGDAYDRYRALQTNLITKTIEVKDGHELTHDLVQIWRLIQSGSPLTIESRLQPGSKVRIKSGPLTGVEGVILRREGVEYLFVAVNFLQQGALVKLQGNEVESVL